MFDLPAQALAHQLGQAHSGDDVWAAQMANLSAYDELNRQKIAETAARLDCRAGCSLCCSMRVDLFAHEAFLIAHHVQTTFSTEERRALDERLEAHAARVLPLTPLEHAAQNNPCPLLRAGCCSVYTVRPMACRRHHSLDVGVCQYTYDHPADLETPAAHQPAVFQALTHAMQSNAAVYAELGFDTSTYELGTALQEALEDPASWESWATHLEAFVRASLTTSPSRESL